MDNSHIRPPQGVTRQYPPCTAADFGPYFALDHEYRHLRVNQSFIRQIPEVAHVRYPNVEDIEMDEPFAIKTTLGARTTIGTSGVATCVAICGRANTGMPGERVFGILHHSGGCSAEAAVESLLAEMDSCGAVNPEFWLVGGLVVPRQCANSEGSYQVERDLLACSGRTFGTLGRFEIKGFTLHCSAGEYRGNWNDESHANAVNVVVREDGIYYSKGPLFNRA